MVRPQSYRLLHYSAIVGRFCCGWMQEVRPSIWRPCLFSMFNVETTADGSELSSREELLRHMPQWLSTSAFERCDLCHKLEAFFLFNHQGSLCSTHEPSMLRHLQLCFQLLKRRAGHTRHRGQCLVPGGAESLSGIRQLLFWKQ